MNESSKFGLRDVDLDSFPENSELRNEPLPVSACIALLSEEREKEPQSHIAKSHAQSRLQVRVEGFRFSIHVCIALYSLLDNLSINICINMYK